MDLILHAKNISGPDAKLQLAFQSMDSTVKTEVFTSVESVATRLLQTSCEEAVVVLVAKNRDELTELLPILSLFNKVRVVMLLPNQEAETIKMGYKQETRFFGFIDRGLSEIKAILGKMSPPKTEKNLQLNRDWINENDLPANLAGFTE